MTKVGTTTILCLGPILVFFDISIFAVSQSFNLFKYSHLELEKGALNSTTTNPS